MNNFFRRSEDLQQWVNKKQELPSSYKEEEKKKLKSTGLPQAEAKRST